MYIFSEEMFSSEFAEHKSHFKSVGESTKESWWKVGERHCTSLVFYLCFLIGLALSCHWLGNLTQLLVDIVIKPKPDPPTPPLANSFLMASKVLESKNNRKCYLVQMELWHHQRMTLTFIASFLVVHHCPSLYFRLEVLQSKEHCSWLWVQITSCSYCSYWICHLKL